MARPNTKPTDTDPVAQQAPVKKSARFVTVASKLPMHITLQLCIPQTKTIPGRYGNEEEKTFVPSGDRHVIRGTGFPEGTIPKGFPKRPNMSHDENGYALTRNIPAYFWEEWLRQNRDTDMVRNGMIKGAAADDIESLVSDFLTLDSGLGPSAQDGDRRAPKPMDQKAMTPVEKAQVSA